MRLFLMLVLSACAPGASLVAPSHDAEPEAAWETAEPAARCGSATTAEEIAEVESWHEELFGAHYDEVSWTGILPFRASFQVMVHVVTDGQIGAVSQQQIDDQLAVLNLAYAPVGVDFTLAAVDTTDNALWFGRCDSTAEFAMKTALHAGGPTDLNLYICGPRNGTLGVATWPWKTLRTPMRDGVIIHAGTVPGGAMPDANLGDTAVHEVGHWLGLFHTFEGGCVTGDSVADTTPEQRPGYGCPTARDTCAGGGPDPVTNYMDYSDDACMDRFSQGQINRMQAMITNWR